MLSNNNNSNNHVHKVGDNVWVLQGKTNYMARYLGRRDEEAEVRYANAGRTAFVPASSVTPNQGRRLRGAVATRRATVATVTATNTAHNKNQFPTAASAAAIPDIGAITIPTTNPTAAASIGSSTPHSTTVAVTAASAASTAANINGTVPTTTTPAAAAGAASTHHYTGAIAAAATATATAATVASTNATILTTSTGVGCRAR